MPMTLEIDDNTQRELIMAASRAVGFIAALVDLGVIDSETQRTAALEVSFDIQEAVTAAIKAQKVAA
jgi:hypothetical protein